ncbi:unnamed protein product [Closterium sp. NIES-54]
MLMLVLVFVVMVVGGGDADAGSGVCGDGCSSGCRIHETSRVASSIKKSPGLSKINGFERNGAGLSVLKAPDLTASDASAAAHSAASTGAAANGAASNGAAASKVVKEEKEKEKKDDDNDDFPGGSGSGRGVGGRGVTAQGRASSSGSKAASPSFGSLVGPSPSSSSSSSSSLPLPLPLPFPTCPCHIHFRPPFLLSSLQSAPHFTFTAFSSFQQAAAAVTIAAAAAVTAAAGATAGGEYTSELSDTATLVAMVTTLQSQASSLRASRQTALASVAASHWPFQLLPVYAAPVNAPLSHKKRGGSLEEREGGEEGTWWWSEESQSMNAANTSPAALSPSSPNSPLDSLKRALTSLALPIPFHQLGMRKRGSADPVAGEPASGGPSPGNAEGSGRREGGEWGWVAAAVLVLLPLLLGPSDALGM